MAERSSRFAVGFGHMVSLAAITQAENQTTCKQQSDGHPINQTIMNIICKSHMHADERAINQTYIRYEHNVVLAFFLPKCANAYNRLPEKQVGATELLDNML